MEKFSELIKIRRSMRKFTDEELTQDEVVALLRSALMAPSSKGCHPWEFVVVDDTLEETAFQNAVRAAEEGIAAVGICCSVGASWRAGPVCVREKLDEADRRMYEAKRRYYSVQAHDRRNRPREPRQQEGPAT